MLCHLTRSFYSDASCLAGTTSSSRQVTPPLTQGQSADRQSLQLNLSFGEPNGILHRPQSTQPSPTPLSSTNLFKPDRPPLPPLITRQDSSTESDTSCAPDVHSPKLTSLEIEQERKQAMIPSSKSPSPMKIPNVEVSTPRRRGLQRQGTRMLSVSPTKLTREASKALRDNITSLLGKRQPSAGMDEEAVNVRTGKRARPQRSKVCCDLSISCLDVFTGHVILATLPTTFKGASSRRRSGAHTGAYVRGCVRDVRRRR